MAVERHPGFQAQGVAGGEARRDEAERRACGKQSVPQGGGHRVRDHELEAVLARVAGAGDEDVFTGEAPSEPCVVSELGEALDGEPRGRADDLLRTGALHRDESDVVGDVVDHGVADVALPRRGHECPVSGVGDHEEVLVTAAVDDDVVDHSAGLGEQERVFRLADLHRGDPSGQRAVQDSGGAGTAERELGHVRDVEQARRLADGVVFGEVGCVADGHRPAAEVGEGCSERAMAVVERGGAEVGHEFSPGSGGGCRDPGIRELPLCHGPESFADAASRHRFHRRRIPGHNRFQRGSLFRAAGRGRYADLRDWRGGLLLRCPAPSEEDDRSSPARVIRPVFCCAPSIACRVPAVCVLVAMTLRSISELWS